ncbi:MAG: hypothetical protein KIC46_07670, partial [Clostridiales bacterium]|nr:hypothetical protein [Clostridiales bacterium]
AVRGGRGGHSPTRVSLASFSLHRAKRMKSRQRKRGKRGFMPAGRRCFPLLTDAKDAGSKSNQQTCLFMYFFLLLDL